MKNYREPSCEPAPARVPTELLPGLVTGDSVVSRVVKCHCVKVTDWLQSCIHTETVEGGERWVCGASCGWRKWECSETKKNVIRFIKSKSEKWKLRKSCRSVFTGHVHHNLSSDECFSTSCKLGWDRNRIFNVRQKTNVMQLNIGIFCLNIRTLCIVLLFCNCSVNT